MMMDKVENTLVDLMECLARCEGIEADTQQDILILMARLEGLEPRPQPDHKEGEGVEWEPGVDLPPVGAMVDIEGHGLVYGDGESGEVLGHIEGTAIVRMSYGLGCFEARVLKPLKSHREKCIEAAMSKVSRDFGDDPVYAYCFTTSDYIERAVGQLHDAGFRLPNDKEGE